MVYLHIERLNALFVCSLTPVLVSTLWFSLLLPLSHPRTLDCDFLRSKKRCVNGVSNSCLYSSFLGVLPSGKHDCKPSCSGARLDHWQESDPGAVAQQPMVQRSGRAQDWRSILRLQGRSWGRYHCAQELPSPFACPLLQVAIPLPIHDLCCSKQLKTFVVLSPIFKPTHGCDNFLCSRQPPGCLQCCLVGAEPKEGDVWSLDSVQVELAIICNSSSKHPCSFCRCSRSW